MGKRKSVVDLAVCAVFSHEDPYLHEFVEWYVRQGAKRIVLYQNDPGPLDLKRVARKRHRKFVQLVDWRDATVGVVPGPQTIQKRAYEDFRTRVAPTLAKWAVVVDIDEFAMPLRDRTLRKMLVRRYEPRQRNIAAIKMQVHHYSFRPHLTPPKKELHIWQAFVFRKPVVRGWHQLKAIINCRKTKAMRFESVHTPKIARGAGRKVSAEENVRVNHYFSKSIQEMDLRRAFWQPRAAIFNTDSAVRTRERDDVLRQAAGLVRDDTMVRYAKKLKLRVKTYPLIETKKG